jgi:hypothetical protein
MKRTLLTALAAGALWTALWAQAPGAPESLSAWPYFKEVAAPSGAAGLAGLTLDRQTLNRIRDDAADLRLYDAAGHEIPYALRVRREVDTQDDHAIREFNRAVEGGAAVVSCDLGANAPEHNQVEIATSGNNFRRQVTVEGSADGANWATLITRALVFRFASSGRSAEQREVEYPASRFRYLRLRVERDPQADNAPPEITGLRVRRTVRAGGEIVHFQGVLEAREPGREGSRPASIWRVDFGARIPIQGLVIAAGGGAFSRPFSIMAIDDPPAPRYLASGDLTRSPDAPDTPLKPAFGEQYARRLKLTVTDDRNAPLAIASIDALSAARQLILELSASAPSPLRLYYGNPKAMAPRYDFATRLPAGAVEISRLLSAGAERANPIYAPEPKPFTERAPWLAYAVLAAACLALAAFLVKIARAAAPPAIGARKEPSADE